MVLAPGVSLVVDSAKRDLSAVIEWGRQKMLDGAYDSAIQHFTTALDLKPGLMHALVSRGFCHLTLGDEDKAQRDFAEVITKDAGFNRNIYVLIALCFKRSGDYHTAIRYLSRCISQFALFKPALIARGELSLKVRDYQKARVDFQQVLNDAPAHLVARRGLGDAMRGLGNFKEALKQYSRAIEDAVNALRQEQSKVDGGAHGDSEGSGGASKENCNNSRGSKASELGRMASSEGASIIEVRRDSDEFSLPGMEEGISSVGRSEDNGVQNAESPDNMQCLQDEPVCEPAQIKSFMIDVFLRRALILRLIGDLEGAGADLIEILQVDPRHGLALFWYGKVLLEQHRHKEAPAFLQASIQHHEETRSAAHGLLGALLMKWPDPDCEGALDHLREATRLSPCSQSIRITMWICSSMAALRKSPRDARGALGFLDRALSALTSAPVAGSIAKNPPLSSRTSRGQQKSVAGSGVAAACALSASKISPEEIRSSATRALVTRREELAQGDDLELTLECRTFLQLIARDAQQQTAEVPALLYVLRTVALCDMGRWEEAVSDCRKALVIDPKDEETQYTLHIASGILRSKNLEYEAAVGCFTKAIRMHPVSTEGRIHRAIALACAARAKGAGGCASGAGTGPEVVSARASQLLADSVQDLEAVEQQALISGAPLPLGAGHLRAACLCSLGRPEEAWDVLVECAAIHGENRGSGRRGWPSWAGGDDANIRQHALEAEVLVMLGRHREAADACTAVLGVNTSGQVEARLMRGCCWSEIGESARAFEDYREALVLAPERVDVHEASGDLFLVQKCFAEAITAFNTASKLGDSLSPRLAYKRALAHLALGNVGMSLKDLNRALRVSPTMPVFLRARDGVAALQAALDGDYRHAHVRFNMLLHSAMPGAHRSSSDRLAPLFLPHELVLYRGACSLYMGEIAAAIQDFQTALELARRFAVEEASMESQGQGRPVGGSSSSSASANFDVDQQGMSEMELGCQGTSSGTSELRRRLRLPREVATQEGLNCFECEALYNVALCHLMSKDYRSALSICEQLRGYHAALETLGSQAQCLVWFLVGVCHLALGEANEEIARESFMRSYAHDPVHVDDFLRRHGKRHAPSPGMGPGGVSSTFPSLKPRVGGPAAAMRQPGGVTPPPSARPPASAREPCDAASEAVCCLRREQGKPSACFPPCRLQVKDVIIWGRPSVGWPFIQPPELTAPTNLARLDLLQHRGTQHPVASGRVD